MSTRRPARTWGAAAIALWAAYLAAVLLLPDAAGTRRAPVAPLVAIVAALLAGLIGWLALAAARPATTAARALAHRLPWIAFGGGWFLVWQLSTVKSGLLAPPYFAAPEVLIAAFADDWTLPAKCMTSSGLLLLVGYLVGSAVGLVTGLLMGWPPRADYWLHPLLETVGPVPASALPPLAVLVLPTTYLPASFIMALGAWFPMATMTRAGTRCPDPSST